MIYPVGDGTRTTFERDWYVAQGFGNPTSYGVHDGADINIKTGGDTDLGQELKAIAKGEIVYYHYGSHPTQNFGRHLVYKITGDFGTRFVHYAHCLDVGFLNLAQEVVEGRIVARLGKSGTPYAHLHMAIFKVDPTTLPSGIDSIAHNTNELNQIWEDPIAFLNTWTQVSSPVITEQTHIPLGGTYGEPELQQVRSMLIAKDADLVSKSGEITNLKQRIQAAKNALG